MVGAKALIFVLSLATSLGTTTEKYGAVLMLPSESQSLARQLVSHILFNDIHTSQKTMKKFSRACSFLSNPTRPGSPRYGYENAVADVIRIRCGCVLNASLRVE